MLKDQRKSIGTLHAGLVQHRLLVHVDGDA
jgi:hypothetical protein